MEIIKSIIKTEVVYDDEMTSKPLTKNHFSEYFKLVYIL
jgi:hypothetical protein